MEEIENNDTKLMVSYLSSNQFSNRSHEIILVQFTANGQWQSMIKENPELISLVLVKIKAMKFGFIEIKVLM